MKEMDTEREREKKTEIKEKKTKMLIFSEGRQDDVL